jgi:hypothetical protein
MQTLLSDFVGPVENLPVGGNPSYKLSTGRWRDKTSPAAYGLLSNYPMTSFFGPWVVPKLRQVVRMEQNSKEFAAVNPEQCDEASTPIAGLSEQLLPTRGPEGELHSQFLYVDKKQPRARRGLEGS